MFTFERCACAADRAFAVLRPERRPGADDQTPAVRGSRACHWKPDASM